MPKGVVIEPKLPSGGAFEPQGEAPTFYRTRMARNLAAAAGGSGGGGGRRRRRYLRSRVLSRCRKLLLAYALGTNYCCVPAARKFLHMIPRRFHRFSEAKMVPASPRDDGASNEAQSAGSPIDAAHVIRSPYEVSCICGVGHSDKNRSQMKDYNKIIRQQNTLGKPTKEPTNS